MPLTDVKRIIKIYPKYIRYSEREVLNYNNALIWLEKSVRKGLKFDLFLILSIHKSVVEELMPVSRFGKLRKEAVFVNDPKLRKTVYWPPDYKDVQALMKDLVEYVVKNEENVDPLISAGIFHKQFVVIHPFMDENERTVRLATKVLLFEMGLNKPSMFLVVGFFQIQKTIRTKICGSRIGKTLFLLRVFCLAPLGWTLSECGLGKKRYNSF